MGASKSYWIDPGYLRENPVPKQGSFVVVDPTGRDLLDCAEVGLVMEVREDEDGPTYMVSINGKNQVIACTIVAAVLS